MEKGNNKKSVILRRRCSGSQPLFENNEVLNKNLSGQHTAKAFTLIELLVVVLIIGILSAIALPQYQKAVIKSRYATLKALTKSIADANEVIYLANGSYTDQLDDLGVMPANKLNTSTNTQFVYDWGYCSVHKSEPGTTTDVVACYNSTLKMSYEIYLSHSPTYAGFRKCVVYQATEATEMRNQICKAETGNTTYQNLGTSYWWTYL